MRAVVHPTRATVDALALCTPKEDWIALDVGPLHLEVLEKLRLRGFDQAPVLDGEVVAGAINLEDAFALLEAGKPLAGYDTKVIHYSVTATCAIEKLLAPLSVTDRRAVFVTPHPGENVTSPGVIGMITISDLNRHPLRVALYDIMGAFEANLVRLVESHFSDAWTWLELLADDKKAPIIGYWELSKRKGLDIGPSSSLYLVQLLEVIGKTEPLRSKLGFSSKKKFDDATGRIADCRNRVMHPVRHLVLQTSDVASLLEIVRTVMRLNELATLALS